MISRSLPRYLIFFFFLINHSVSAQFIEEVISPDKIPLIPVFDTAYAANHNHTGLFNPDLVSHCPNSNFTYGNFDIWTGCKGSYTNPCQLPFVMSTDTTGINARFKIFPADPPLTDYYSDGMLPLVFPGEDFSARLGNNQGGSQGERLKYTVVVNPQSYLFVYRYAVVLNNNTQHDSTIQPKFTIDVVDSVGNLIDGCGHYSVTANPGLVGSNGWHLSSHNAGSAPAPVEWREWQTVGMNLLPWSGKTLTILFTTRDCNQGGHFGYAYISAYCSYLQLVTAMCEGDTSATLTGPPGFGYLWSTTNGDTTVNGDTTSTIVVPHPTSGSTYNCLLTALNGCQVTINTTLTYTQIHAGFTEIPNCAGRPTSFVDTSWVSQNEVTAWRWFFGDPASGANDSSNVKYPVHYFSAPGPYTVTLIAYSTEGCADTVTKTINIGILPEMTSSPLVLTTCSNTPIFYPLTANLPDVWYNWRAFQGNPGLITGYTSNFTPNNPEMIITDNILNYTTNLDTVYYRIVPKNQYCTGDSITLKVAVQALPDLINTPLLQTQCSDVSTNVVLQSSSPTTLFTWNCMTGSSNLSGFSNNYTPTLLLDQTIHNSGTTTDTLRYYIAGHDNSCVGLASVLSVAVVPLPSPAISGTSSICTNLTTTYTTQNSMSNYLWNVSPGGSITSGGQPADNTVTVLWTTPGTGNVSVNYSVPVYGCTSVTPAHLDVTVKPRPSVINNITVSRICSGLSNNFLLIPDLPGTTFSWIASGTPGVSGYSNSSGQTISQPLTNSTFGVPSVTYTVTPSLNACDGNIATFQTFVYPVSDVIITPAGETFCSGGATNIVLSSHADSVDFTWTVAGSSINLNGFVAGSGDLIQQTISNTGYRVDSVTYNVTPFVKTCPGATNYFAVRVLPRPVTTFESCSQGLTTTGSKSFRLRGGNPPGGTYYGNGVNGGIFDPSTAGTGSHLITYSYINNWGCDLSASQTINVFAPVPFNCGDTLRDIRDNKSYPTVLIGSQCWTAANLNYGDPIGSAAMQRDNCLMEKYCFGDNFLNCSLFGGLYQWDEMMQYDAASESQGFCPPGWHVPSENDWTDLFSNFTACGFAASDLKYTGFSGFNAFLYGAGYDNASWKYNNFATILWSSTSHGNYKALAHGMNIIDPSVSLYPGNRTNAFGIRCVKD